MVKFEVNESGKLILLNQFPPDMTERQTFDYVKAKFQALIDAKRKGQSVYSDGAGDTCAFCVFAYRMKEDNPADYICDFCPLKKYGVDSCMYTVYDKLDKRRNSDRSLRLVAIKKVYNFVSKLIREID